jgi:hypothetical protein
MLTEIGNAHAAAKMYESAGVGDPRTTGALGVVWSTIHTYAPNPSEPAATYAERMVAWSREMLARHGLAAAEDAFAMIRDAAI